MATSYRKPLTIGLFLMGLVFAGCGSPGSEGAVETEKSAADSNEEAQSQTKNALSSSGTCSDNRAIDPDVDGPAGLMVQTSTASDLCLLQKSLDHMCRAHRSGAGVINDLVLTDVVQDGTENLNTEVLDLVLSYRGCFDNLFLGTISETIINQPYQPSTIENQSSRWKWLYASRRVADKLLAYMNTAAPGYAWHWYVSYEANLNYFTDATYRNCYIALMQQHTSDLLARRWGAVFWSPTFWTDYNALSSSSRNNLQSAIGNFFNRVPGISWVAIQDHVGCSSAFSCSDAVGYWRLVHAAAPGLASLQLNMEYFDGVDGAPIGPGNPSRLARRLACYRSAGVPVGASFDFRYWYATHGH